MASTEKKVAEELMRLFHNYASAYDFHYDRDDFRDFSLDEMKKLDTDKFWEFMSPKLKELVLEHISAVIDNKEDEAATTTEGK